MPYCNKCGKSLSENVYGDLCENCGDKRSPSRFISLKRADHAFVRKRHSLRDSGITFAIIMALIFLGVILLGGF